MKAGQAEDYKSGFLKNVEEFKRSANSGVWVTEDGLPKGGTNEVLQSHGVDIYHNAQKFAVSSFGEKSEDGKTTTGLLTKVTSCHDIWMSNQYGTPEWRPKIYQSVYTVDFKDKYF